VSGGGFPFALSSGAVASSPRARAARMTGAAEDGARLRSGACARDGPGGGERPRRKRPRAYGWGWASWTGGCASKGVAFVHTYTDTYTLA
jgi:hypothetical protein